MAWEIEPEEVTQFNFLRPVHQTLFGPFLFVVLFSLYKDGLLNTINEEMLEKV